MKFDKIIPDSTVIVNGLLSKKIENKELKASEVIVHEALLKELLYQANNEKSLGYIGLDELKHLKEIFKDNMTYSGKRPSHVETKYTTFDEINYDVITLAFESGATLVTGSKTQVTSALARGVNACMLEGEEEEKAVAIESFFDQTTMSVHLKESVPPFAKKGQPGKWNFVQLRDNLMTQDEIRDISREIIESSKSRKDSFIEIERAGSTIVQMQNYRIVIARPPFSDGWEITAVRPIKKLNLEDYNLSPELKRRLSEQAEGILIAGAPGHGKSTMASALAEYYANQNKIVKTIEAPRDMILSPRITQYAISHGDAQEIHDILLLSRPDYSIFDEMRNTRDFELFTDLRLAGIGLAGVVHATNPVDAIHRFIGRTELGVIPQVIDTVIFIKDGRVAKVLGIKMVVKCPSGMLEADLARPVIEIRDFATGKLEYELYTYGEETVIIPVAETGSKKSATMSLAQKQIEKELLKYTSSVEAEMVSENKVIVYIPERDIARIIGPKGVTINKIEKDLGLSIEVKSIDSQQRADAQPVKYHLKQRGTSLIFSIDKAGVEVETYIDGTFLFTSTSSKKGEMKVSMKSNIGRELVRALDLNKNVELRQAE